jgi:hypothetical protein
MDIWSLDLTSLTWQQFAVAVLAVTVVRWLLAVVAAIKPPNTFSVSKALAVFRDHVLNIVAPIVGVAFIAMSLPGDSAAHLALWTLACGGLALYVVDTVKAAAANWGTAPDSPGKAATSPKS